MKRIKIIAVPDGEAPLYVREAWVGCIIPVVTEYDAPARGVLTHELVKNIKGFRVSTSVALLALLKQNKIFAYAWWVENYFSRFLIFEEIDVEILE